MSDFRSPFGSDSWEPRFAVEHRDPNALVHAVELWRLCAAAETPFSATDPIKYIAREPGCLRVAHPKLSNYGADEWVALDTPIVAADVPALVTRWLATATYPKQPWFDGGEAKGFCVFYAYYGSDQPCHRRSLVVIPKWFEVHK